MKNEWGVTPGTQDKLTRLDAPVLSDAECEVVNLFRALTVEQGKEAINFMSTMAISNLDNL